MADVNEKDKLYAELESVRSLNDKGLLFPKDVVTWARNNKNSALWAYIEKEKGWDDTTSAERWRMELAQRLIRVVIVTPPETNRRERGYVSLTSNRVHGGGYTPTRDALISARQEMINEALSNLTNFGNRYTHLPELDDLFDEVRKYVIAYRQNLNKSNGAA
jgi:hypothetical protein